MIRANRRDFLKAAAFCSLCGTRAAAAKAGATGALPVKQIADGVFAFAGVPAMMNDGNRGEICNLGFVIGEEAVAVIDSGGSVAEGRALIDAVRAQTDRPIRYLINTHMHPDHIFGNGAFDAEKVTIVGHRNLRRALESRGDYYLESYRSSMGAELMQDVRIVLPTRLVSAVEEMDIGKRKLTLQPWKPAHTDNDLTVFDQKTKVLFTGDLCFAEHLPTLDGSLLGWVGQLDMLRAIEASMAVPGHGPVPSPWPDVLERQKRYFDVLIGDVRKAIREGVPMMEAVKTAGESERGNWQLFDDYNQRNATAAYAELEWQ
jgi:quinoprotein relay system zinc metallohydrolase 2